MFRVMPDGFRAYLSEMISELENKTRSQPQEAAEILASSFTVLVRKLKIDEVADDKLTFIALILLTLYFDHQGNWAAMRGELA